MWISHLNEIEYAKSGKIISLSSRMEENWKNMYKRIMRQERIQMNMKKIKSTLGFHVSKRIDYITEEK